VDNSHTKNYLWVKMYKCGKKCKISQKLMLIGHYTHTIDPKKRISVPVKWRTTLGEKIVITSGLDESLFIWSVEEWKKIADKIVNLGFMSSDSRQFSRFMFSNAYEVDIDKVGRILVPENLCKFANLKEGVVLSGMYTRIEVWNETKYSEMMKIVEKDAEDLSLRISKLDVE
jgi:MraZ protein